VGIRPIRVHVVVFLWTFYLSVVWQTGGIRSKRSFGRCWFPFFLTMDRFDARVLVIIRDYDARWCAVHGFHCHWLLTGRAG
jgi:hypothetical protein